MSSAAAAPARYIMIGGFLGAGKTTAIGKLAAHLTAKGHRVGLITNDQAGGLVDTRVLRSQGFATEEIAGGCFCCRFNSLVQAAGKLTEAQKPDVFVAEPVGSCTDLVATVTYPLRRLYGNDFSIAPFSVLVDPTRARRVLGLEQGGTFSSKVNYIFEKQLEEADFIVITKRDLITDAQEAELRAALSARFPHAEIFAVSARDNTGLEPWFRAVESREQSVRKAIEVDYDVYAEGEALLGWLNATVNTQATEEFEAADLLRFVATDIQSRLRSQGAEIAHFKMTFSPDDSLSGELASINVVRTDATPEIGLDLDEPTTSGQLIVNLRAETSPDALVEQVRESLKGLRKSFPGLSTNIEHVEHFRPGRPTPTHRDVGVQASA
jgi:G3E family GTPase